MNPSKASGFILPGMAMPLMVAASGVTWRIEVAEEMRLRSPLRAVEASPGCCPYLWVPWEGCVRGSSQHPFILSGCHAPPD